MKKCPVCSHEMEDEALFCSRCGERMPEPSPAPEPVKDAPSSSEDDVRQKKSVPFKPLLITICVVAVALLALVADLLIFADTPADVLKKEVATYCAWQFPALKIEEIEIGDIEKSSHSSYRHAEVTLTIDGALTVSEYDNLYYRLSGQIFDSKIQVSPLRIIEDSGNDYESGYWDRQMTAATAPTTPSSISNPGKGFTAEDAKWAVYKMAKEQIPDYLSCPSTMEICSYEDATIKDTGYNIWKGEGYFDAENLYGATVRGKWNITCKIENGVCHLVKLKIDDVVVYNNETQ